MKRSSIFLPFALAMSLLSGCSDPVGLGSPGAVLRWGTSFGECLGYCKRELEITRGGLRLTRSSWTPATHPPQVREAALPAGEWERLDDALRRADLGRLQAVYGCPDCADGGAEWVEAESGGVKQRVTYEYGKPPAALQPLLARIAALNAGFE